MESGDQIWSEQESNPELENFLGRVDEVSDIIRGLASTDLNDQQKALRKADILLHDKEADFDEDTKFTVKSDRSVINKAVKDGGDASTNAFMRMTEKDAKDRTENKKKRKEKSDSFRKAGNKAFSVQNYAEALCCYNQAIQLIKDSPCLYNNRALTYIRIGIYTKAIEDCERAIELADYSMKARLLMSKAYFLKGEAEKCKECLRETQEKYPTHSKMVETFEKDLFEMRNKSHNDVEDLLESEKVWYNASLHRQVEENQQK